MCRWKRKYRDAGTVGPRRAWWMQLSGADSAGVTAARSLSAYHLYYFYSICPTFVSAAAQYLARLRPVGILLASSQPASPCHNSPPPRPPASISTKHCSVRIRIPEPRVQPDTTLLRLLSSSFILWRIISPDSLASPQFSLASNPTSRLLPPTLSARHSLSLSI
ncbi:hypothetical protein DFH11DRAFT_697623 [Phellopilus nigrolimitatus]|nr:hypothetical protein DFH11DRAFT_697623 [Phellopilus nigrolimitatus]